MAASTKIPTKLKKSQVINAGPQLKLDTETLVALLVVAGAGAPDTSKTGVQFIADVTAANAEVTGTGYARQTLAGVTVAFDGTGTIIVDFSFSAITFLQNAAGFTNGAYLIIADTTIGANDAAHPVVAVCDLGAVVSAVSGDVVLSCPSGGLIAWA